MATSLWAAPLVDVVGPILVPAVLFVLGLPFYAVPLLLCRLSPADPGRR